MIKMGFALLTVLALVLVISPTMGSAQATPPYRIHGTVQLDGGNVPDHTIITATIAGETYTVRTPSVYGASTYYFQIDQPTGRNYTKMTITFTISNHNAIQTATWQAGENIVLNLSGTMQSLSVQLSSIGNQLVRVWGLSGDVWQMYDPHDLIGSDLTSLTAGRGYFINVSSPCALSYNTANWTLIQGWNLVGWTGGFPTSPTPTYTPVPPKLSSIAVTPAIPNTMTVNFTQQLVATGTYADGSQQNITSQVTWKSSDTGIASISSNGLVTAVAAGTTSITAALSGITSPAVSLTVVWIIVPFPNGFPSNVATGTYTINVSYCVEGFCFSGASFKMFNNEINQFAKDVLDRLNLTAAQAARDYNLGGATCSHEISYAPFGGNSFTMTDNITCTVPCLTDTCTSKSGYVKYSITKD